MSDQIPEWLDEWITDNIEEATPERDIGIHEMIDAGAVRTLLSQFTLCEKEPTAWGYQTPSHGMWIPKACVNEPPDSIAHMKQRLYREATGVKP